MTPEEHAWLQAVERITTYMARYATAAAGLGEGDKATYRIMQVQFAGDPNVHSLLNPVAYVEDLIAKVAVASPTVDLTALKSMVLSALTDPSVLQAEAHAEAVQLHNDLPAG